MEVIFIKKVFIHIFKYLLKILICSMILISKYLLDNRYLLISIILMVLHIIILDEYDNLELIMLVLPSLLTFRTDTGSYVTWLLLFAFIKFLISRRRKIKLTKNFTIALLFIITYETIHALNYTNQQLFQSIRWALLLAYAGLYLGDMELKINFEKTNNYFFWGIIISTASGFLSNPNYLLSVGIVRFQGMQGDPNGYAQMALIVGLFYLCLYFVKNMNSRLYIYKFIILIIFAFTTLSRAFIITFLLTMVCFIIIEIKKWNFKFLRFTVITLIIGLITYRFFNEYIMQIIDSYYLRLSYDDINQLSSGRYMLGNYYLTQVMSKPTNLLFGKGLIGHINAYGMTTGTHNIYLELLASWGIIGTSFYVYYIYSLFYSTAKKYKRGVSHTICIIPLVAFLMYSISLQAVAKYSTYFILIMIIECFYYSINNKEVALDT